MQCRCSGNIELGEGTHTERQPRARKADRSGSNGFGFTYGTVALSVARPTDPASSPAGRSRAHNRTQPRQSPCSRRGNTEVAEGTHTGRHPPARTAPTTAMNYCANADDTDPQAVGHTTD